MAEHRPLKRPYRSKRNRPCDLCRSRKVHCHIEDSLPCSLCAKYDMNCTFIMGPVKKHRQSITLDAPAALNLGGENSTGRGNDDVISLDIDSGLSLQSLMDLRRSRSAIAEDQALNRSPDRAYFTGQTILDGQLDSNHIFDFEMLQFNTPSFSGALNVQESSSFLQEIPPRDEQPDIRTTRSAESESISNVNSIDRKDGVHGVYFGLSGDTDPYLLRHLPYDERGEFKMFKLVYRRLGNGINRDKKNTLSFRKSPSVCDRQQESQFSRSNLEEGPVPTYFMMAADELGDCGKEDTAVRKDVAPETVREELDRLILPEDGRRLFGLFYKYVFPALPVISRSQLNIGSSLSPSLPSTTIISKLPTHLLAAIYASALAFWHYDDHLCVMKAYNRPPANQLWRIAYEEILRDIHTPRLSVLQACLLYLQKQRAPQDSAAADTPFTWSFLSWTVGLATSLGLHVDCANWDIPAWEKRLRRRLWWAIYSEEKFRSLLVGQPTIIRRDQWDVSSLKDEDFFLDAPPEDAISYRGSPLEEIVVGQNFESGLHSRYLAALAQIVDDVYESLFTLKATRVMSVDFYLCSKTVKTLQGRLEAWNSSLPSSLRVQGPSAPNLDSNVSLNLAHITLEILLHRAILREVPQPGYSPNSTQATNHIPPTGDLSTAIQRQFIDALNSARVAIEFTGDMSSRDFSGFWHSWSRICFSTISNFVMLLMVKAPTREYATTARSLADKWREILRFQSRSCEQMNMGMLRLDAIYWMGIDNLSTDEQWSTSSK